MFLNNCLICFILYYLLMQISATTHFIVTKEGMIQPQIDSPYILRRPHDLIAFLNQSKYKSMIDNLFEELMTIKNDLMFKIDHIDKFTAEFKGNKPNQKPCENYFLKIEDIFSTITSRKYFQRIENLKTDVPNEILSNSNVEPNCDKFLPLNFSMFTFDHLKGMTNRKNLSMYPEYELQRIHDLIDITNEYFPKKLATGLKKNPNSWKLHTLASYYWRYKGQGPKAIECARIATYLAPREFKDIPLLSLGTIFQRARKNVESVIILTAAIDHDLECAENHFALGNALFLLSDFENALQSYERAVKLDNFFYPQIDFIKKSLKCFKYVKKRLINMEELLDQMLIDLEKFAEKKILLEECHDKLIKEQVPLGSRYNESPHDNENMLLQRIQYCSTRLGSESTEPVVFCDFYSDIQMRMKLKVVAIDLINKYVERTTDLIRKHLEDLGVFTYLDVDKIGDIDDDMDNIL